MDGMRRLELSTLNNGAAQELFDRELKEVMKNIDDPSTEAKEKRKITIEFTFTPNEQREMGVLEIKAKSNLAPARATGSTFILRHDGRQVTPWEPNCYQPTLGLDSNVRPFGKDAAANQGDD